MPKLKIRDVELPVEVEDFTVPDFIQFIDFYPEYREKAGEHFWPIQAYVCWICNELARLKVRPGRTSEEWLHRVFNHFGTTAVIGWLAKTAD